MESRKRMKSRLRSFTNLLRVYGRDFASVSYVFLLIVVGKEDPIGFFGFYIDTFPMLKALVPEVAGVVPFCICG